MNFPESASSLSALWRPRQPILEGALGMMFGILLGDQLAALGAWVWIAAASLAVGVMAVAVQHGEVRKPGVMFWLAAVFCGVALQSGHLERSPARRLAIEVPEGGAAFQGTGVVEEAPVPGRSQVVVRLGQGAIHGVAMPTGGLLLLGWPGSVLPQYGDRVEFRGTIVPLQSARNPGSFDTLSVRKRQGIYARVLIRYASDAEVTARGQGSQIKALALVCRRAMEEAMALGLQEQPEVVQVIQSMVLGTQADASPELLDLFRNTGTIHLFSVSGLHVAMLAAMVFTLFRLLGMRRRTVALMVIPVLWGYCFITGLPPGSLRATLMGTVAMLGLALERPALSWNALGAAALVILFDDPDQLFRPGPQLSFLLVAALLVGAEPMRLRFVRWTQPDAYLPRLLWSDRQRFVAWAGGHTMGAVSVSVVAWIASAPVTLFYFHLWSPSTVPANLVAVLLSWFVLALGLLSGVVGAVWATAALYLNQLNAVFTKALLGALTFCVSLPGGHRYVEWPRWEERPVCEVEALDLAGGGAIYLRLDGEGGRREWLIDCGSEGQFRQVVLPYLRARGVNRLDGLVLTHGDTRHVGGAVPLMNQLPIGEVFDSSLKDRSSKRRAAQRELDRRKQGRALLQHGDRVTLAPGVVLHLLHPSPEEPLRSADDKAMVLRLDLELGRGVKRQILFTSDAGFSTASILQQRQADLRAQVWFKGMHATENIGWNELLKPIGAEAVVIASAPFPRSQVPDPGWLGKVEAMGARVYPQHEYGAVRVAIYRDGGIRVSPYLDASRLRSSKR